MFNFKKQSGKISELIKKKTLLMGILNVTPDSFSDGGKYFDFESAINHAQDLTNKGAHIIDVGGESTRPGAVQVPEEEEIKRVIPVVKELSASNTSLLISIDTYKSKVAKLALEAGADIINDVSGLTMDKEMIRIARDFNCPIVIMHNNGIPACKGIACNTSTERINEIIQWLKTQTEHAIENGINKENIIIDPGIGFGKSAEDDFYIIENLSKFKSLNYPILIGPSKKSFIKKIYGESTDIEAKTKELVDLSIKNGADIVRMHL